MAEGRVSISENVFDRMDVNFYLNESFVDEVYCRDEKNISCFD